MEEQKPEELISHTIVIDEYMVLEWKIPKVITPLQLQAMSKRVNKLFNLSEVQIADEQPTRGYGEHWTDALKNKLKEMYENKLKPKDIRKVLFEMSGGDNYFATTKGLHSQINYLKRTGFLNGKNVSNNTSKVPQEKKVRNKSGVNKRFDDEDVKKIIAIWSSGKTIATEVRDELNKQTGKSYAKKQVADKLYNLKKQGLIK